MDTGMFLGLILGGAGLLLTAGGVALSIWAIGHARAADRRAEDRDERAGQRTNVVGQQVMDIARALGLRSVPEEGVALGATEARRWALGVADVNNDGRDELLVASPWGLHSSMLHVFWQRNAWPDSFGKLAELGSGTPAGFSIGDLDGDGRIELATIQPHGDEPYATGSREEVLYRWDGDTFAEVAIEPQPRPGEPGFDDPERPSRWHFGQTVLSVRL